jgi:peptide-methionine (S)-S-oxide reductase
MSAGAGPAPTAHRPPPTAKASVLRTAVFAGGCFWCMEHDMGGIQGVVKVESGYTGGKLAHPTYRDVPTETTGHYEAVRVTNDASHVDYGFRLSRYWRLVDPTDAGGQFCDRGPSYRTAIFADGPIQRAAAEKSKAATAAKLKGKTVVTQILALGPFWPSGPGHPDYAKRNLAHYALYRTGCGRDARLKQVWGS